MACRGRLLRQIAFGDARVTEANLRNADPQRGRIRKIGCDDDQALAASVTGDEQVVGADRLASLESGADFGGVGGGVRVECEHRKPCGKMFNLPPVMRRAGGFSAPYGAPSA